MATGTADMQCGFDCRQPVTLLLNQFADFRGNVEKVVRAPKKPVDDKKASNLAKALAELPENSWPGQLYIRQSGWRPAYPWELPDGWN